MALSNKERIGRALDTMTPKLSAFVDTRMTAHMGRTWLDQLNQRNRDGGRPATDSLDDPRVLLKVMTHEWRAFKDDLSKSEQGFVRELWGFADKWAHRTHKFDDRDTVRFLDTAMRLLSAIPDTNEEAKALHAMWEDRQRSILARSTDRHVKAELRLPKPEGMNLKPWRSIITPHSDVRTGNFNASEYAADLQSVVDGDAASEYGEPVEFFKRTYLTDGLSDLLKIAARRVSGDMNASPVMNLQTNFGGGKTHSMLGVYHLFGKVPVSKMPQEVQDLLDGLDIPKPGAVNRAVLVGNKIAPAQGISHPDGTHTNTLWGELAWQLGGAEGYAMVAEADQTGTNPGSALSDLLASFAPCVILVDEWVRYAAQLYGDRLPAGEFDSQFTFAQTLTEEVARIDGAFLVVSIPASDTGEGHSSSLEVGGDKGLRALDELRQVVGRTADSWRPATARESFEIVRRRLFEEPDAEARAERAAVAQHFVDFYRANPRSFPSEVSDQEYKRRIEECYPIHPELFDRLYNDWSTLDRFQRTRGVLRFMSWVINALWDDQDAYPLILPATVPIEDERVVSDIIQYLPDPWAPIIDADIDGANAAPTQLDREHALYGKSRIAKRAARCVFIGSAATTTSEHKGIEVPRINLGSAVPGDTVSHFESALQSLRGRSGHLYNDGVGRFWYDTHVSLERRVSDHAETLKQKPEEAWELINQRLRARARRSDLFTAVHVAPESSADIADEDATRLVVLHPRYVHDQKSTSSNAMEFAETAAKTRGNSQRKYRNCVVFLAANRKSMLDLEEAARTYLAWQHVTNHVDEYDLTQSQARNAEQHRLAASGIVDQRIAESYTWILRPTQPKTDQHAQMTELSAGQGDELVKKASARLERQGELAGQHTPLAIHQCLSGPLSSIWEGKGRIRLGELWDYYGMYPYMPRLRDRSVLDRAVRDIQSWMNWQQEGFALASAYNEADDVFEGLVIPIEDSLPQLTDATLLVRPDLALSQRQAERAEHEEVPSADDEVAEDQPEPLGRNLPGRGEASSEAGKSQGKTRFYAVVDVDAVQYGRDLSKVMQEILPHVPNDNAKTSITIEIVSEDAEGFSEEKIRILSENARTLKFKEADFTD